MPIALRQSEVGGRPDRFVVVLSHFHCQSSPTPVQTLQSKQNHRLAPVDWRSAATSTPSFANARIKAFESSRSSRTFAVGLLLGVEPKRTRIFFRLFAASGRAATRATWSMLRIIPLGRLTKLLFIRRFSGLPFYSATKMFRQNRPADGHGAMQRRQGCCGVSIFTAHLPVIYARTLLAPFSLFYPDNCPPIIASAGEV